MYRFPLKMYFCLLHSTEKSIFHRVDKVGERSIRRRLKVHSWYDKDKHKDKHEHKDKARREPEQQESEQKKSAGELLDDMTK